MNIKKVKRICGVRGCRNTDCFAISRTREVGSSVIICRDCLRDGLSAVSDYVPPKQRVSVPPPPLFFNHPAAMNEASEKISADKPVKTAKKEGGGKK